ncbi:MAG: FAD-dependent oxidoreductase [Spirochaetaceae bacterium]|jgi:thioredoxin reductase (NADPH)|nr:FAD-dependent oxidoreductase [Spirochaetaceae bacterium]
MTPDADLMILGAGPAGLAAAQYGARANLRVAVIEALSVGGQALHIDRLENYPGLAPVSGQEFALAMRRQAEDLGAVFIMEKAGSLEKDGGIFTAALASGRSLTARSAVAATGAKHRALGVPGEERLAGSGVSYCAACDGPFFRNKRVFVVGGGDAACDEARFLSRLCAEVVLIHRRGALRAQKALASRIQGSPRIETRFHTRLRGIQGESAVRSLVLERLDTGERYEEDADGVFICVGITPQTAGLPRLSLDGEGYILTDQAMATSLAGLFAAGDVRSCPFRQAVVAAAEGAVAAHSAASYIACG